MWRAREWKGSVDLMDLMGLPKLPGIYRVVREMMNALTAAENGAQKRFSEKK